MDSGSVALKESVLMNTEQWSGVERSEVNTCKSPFHSLSLAVSLNINDIASQPGSIKKVKSALFLIKKIMMGN